MHDRDSLHRFVFEHFPIRGHLVHLDAAWRALIEHADYPAVIRDTLGQAAAASLLLAATIKFEGVLSLQLQGDGPMHLMLVQCTGGLGVRGLARYREGELREARAVLHGEAGTDHGEAGTDYGAAGAGRIADLIGAGNLTVTLETDDSAQRYQGIVPIAGQRLADSLQVYFENSEQLPTQLWLHADAEGASGMLLQKLPAANAAPGAGPVDVAAVDDAWRRVKLIAETLTAEEMRTLTDAQILHRLFNEDDVRLFEPAPVYFRCRCSRERVSGMLQGLGESEARSILAERGEVEVRCDFCNRAYVFDAVDVAQLFNAGAASESGSVH
jgi:molecular chaperone Hsp33